MVESYLSKYINEIGKIPVLLPSKERELGIRIRDEQDSDAVSELARSNLRLVPFISKLSFGEVTMEKIQYGNDGLMVAVWGFDPDIGKFSTYAGKIIRGSIQKGIRELRYAMRIPSTAQTMINRVRRYQDSCFVQGKEFDHEEAARLISKGDAPTSFARKNVDLYQRVINGGNSSIDCLEEDSLSPLDELDELERMNSETIRRALESLDEREHIIIVRRYGLDRQPPMTLKQVAEVLGIGRERVRQVHQGALEKMRLSLSKT